VSENCKNGNTEGELDGQVQFARRAGSLPNNNQQPTVSIEQK
jgi:hypothetical protein